MGLFSSNKTPAGPMDAEQATGFLGLSPGSIFREADNVVQMWCPAFDGLQAEAYYPCTLVNKGNKVAVLLGKKTVSHLDAQCLPDAVKVLQRSSPAKALLVPPRPGRKTAAVLALC